MSAPVHVECFHRERVEAYTIPNFADQKRRIAAYDQLVLDTINDEPLFTSHGLDELAELLRAKKIIRTSTAELICKTPSTNGKTKIVCEAMKAAGEEFDDEFASCLREMKFLVAAKTFCAICWVTTPNSQSMPKLVVTYDVQPNLILKPKPNLCHVLCHVQ